MTLDCSLKDLRLGMVNGRSGFHLSNSFQVSLGDVTAYGSLRTADAFRPPYNAPPQTRGALRDNPKTTA